ncbi:hypothetical protein [Adhaeribacter aerolatus]|nr:hypothetical protein [Adhaeribacter aerolatus]
MKLRQITKLLRNTTKSKIITDKKKMHRRTKAQDDAYFKIA